MTLALRLIWHAIGRRRFEPKYGICFASIIEGSRAILHGASGTSVIERFTTEKPTVVVVCNRTDLDASQVALQVAEAFR